MVETKGGRTKVRLVKNLRDPHDIAERSGGVVTSKGDIPWNIVYQGGEIIWAGYPDKQPELYIGTPWLERPEQPGRHFRGSFFVDAVLLAEDAVTLVSPGFGKDTTVLACELAKGQIREFEVPVENASKNLLKARDMARRESHRFMTSPTRKTVRIERR